MNGFIGSVDEMCDYRSIEFHKQPHMKSEGQEHVHVCRKSMDDLASKMPMLVCGQGLVAGMDACVHNMKQ